ncbi:MAG: hypothetical protein Q4C70_06115 [Planctomycetia bacterium]|nr:hypothetical protein [Planctomycetia bacterium]
MFQPIFHSFVFLFLTIFVLLGIAWWSAPIKNGGRPWLWVGVRWCTLLILGIVLARPFWTQTETEISPGNVLILLDTSRSMSIADETLPGEKVVSGMPSAPRYAAMRKALGNSADALAEMAKQTGTEVYALDQSLTPLTLGKNGKIDFPRTPDGEETALGASLLDALSRTAGRKVLGIVLLSDGAQRALPPRDALPQTASGRMNRLGIPLFTVPFGATRQESQSRDVAVDDLLVDQRVFVNTEVTVSGRIRLDGVAKMKIPVELLVESASGTMETVAQTEIQAETENETLPVRLSWMPKEVGEVKVTLRIPPQHDEVSITNNQLDAFVTVAESGLRVLYLEQAFRPEAGFLRRSLDSADEIQLDMVRLSGQSEDSGNAKKMERMDLLRILQEDYAVILLGDVSANCFQKADLELLTQKIAAGTGLITLGGLQNYGLGGYAETPLAQVLPVIMSPRKKMENTRNAGRNGENSERNGNFNVLGNTGSTGHIGNAENVRNSENSPLIQSAVETISGNSALKTEQWNRPVRFQLTSAGRHHLALALDAEAGFSAQLWGKLPTLDGANRWEGLKPGAVVLAADFTAENEEIPLLLEHSFGRGRVMSLAVDSTWRWWMAGHTEPHKRFWRQLIFWVANQETTLDGTVSLILPQRRFPQEETIKFQVSARLSSGKTPPPPEKNTPSENWRVLLQHPDGSRTEVPLSADQNGMKGEIPAQLTPGDYMLHASVTHQGQKIGESKCRFQIYHHDLELDRAQAEPELLASLAISTGGKSVQPEKLPELWKRLAESREELKIERQIRLPLWDRWWWLALLIGLLTTEWFLRKRGGNV